MPEFRLPYPNLSSSQEEAIKQLGKNLEDLVNDYNRILRDLDAEVFYHVIPIKTGEAPVAVGTFTPSHKIRVVINDTEYDMQLEAK